MSIKKEEVEHIAWLSRLYLTEEEKAGFATQLGDILAHAEKISAADTEGVPDFNHILTIRSVLREDIERSCISNEDALLNAPEDEDGGFVVPQIV